MNTPVTVARVNLVRPASFLAVPLILVAAFTVGALTDGRLGRDASGYLLSLFLYFTVLGWQTVSRSLPFGLTLGASRRSFYSGTALFGVGLALGSGLVLTGLQAIERATGGWGFDLHFFRMTYLLDGPWYATWLTAFVSLAALWVNGMWLGVVHHRWGTLGTVALIALQALVVVAGSLIAHHQHWPVLALPGGSANGLTALELTGVLAALAGLVLAGGLATVRRVTV